MNISILVLGVVFFPARTGLPLALLNLLVYWIFVYNLSPRRFRMWFIMKAVLSGLVIAFAAWLAGKRPVLAGFIIALPLMSMLAILYSYWEYRDMQKINEFAVSILVAVPLSLAFFIPFLLNKWLKMNFVTTYVAALIFLALAYLIHHLIFKAISFR